MKYAWPLLILALTGCKAQQFTQAGSEQGVQVSYRWKHAPGKPSELLLKMVNGSDSARSVHVGLDLYNEGMTVEQFTADTCVRARRTLNGKLNGFYFIPTSVTPEQAAGPDVKVELTELSVTPVVECP